MKLTILFLKCLILFLLLILSMAIYSQRIVFKNAPVDTGRWDYGPYVGAPIPNDTSHAYLLVSIIQNNVAVKDPVYGNLYTIFTMTGYVVTPHIGKEQGWVSKDSIHPISYLDGRKEKLPKDIIVWQYKEIK